jgi:WD40 repeat protein
VFSKLIHLLSILSLFCLLCPVIAESPGQIPPGSFPVADVETIAVSPDGSFILCAGKALTLYNLAGKEVWSETLPGGSCTLAAFTPWEIVVARTGSREVQFRSMEGKRLPGFKTQNDIISLAVSGDGKLIATGEKEFGLNLWDRKGRLIRGFPGLKDEAGSLVFSPDNKTLASGGSWWNREDAEIILWAIDGSSRRVLEERQKAGIHLEYTPGGNYLLSGSFQENKLILWDNLGKPLHTYSRDLDFGNRFVICSDYIASIKKEDLDSLSPGILQIWSLDGTFLDARSFPGETCYSLTAIPGTSRIAAGLINLTSGDCSLRFMDFASYGHTLKRDNQGEVIFNMRDYIPPVDFEPRSPIAIKPGFLPPDSFNSLAFSPDEKWVVATGFDKGPKLYLFNLTGESWKTFTFYNIHLDDAFFSPSGQRFLVLGDQFSLRSAGGELLATLSGGEPYLDAAFLEGDAFITGSYLRGNGSEGPCGLVYFYDREGKQSGEPVRTREPFWGMDSDPVGKHFLCYGEQKVFLYRKDGTLLAAVEDVPGSLKYSTFLGSRQEILVYYDYGFGKASWCGVYDFTGKFLRRFKLSDNDSPLRLAVSPDGHFIACRYIDKIQVFSAFGALLEANLDTGESLESAVRFSPGGKYLGCSGYSTGDVLPLLIWELK